MRSLSDTRYSSRCEFARLNTFIGHSRLQRHQNVKGFMFLVNEWNSKVGVASCSSQGYTGTVHREGCVSYPQIHPFRVSVMSGGNPDSALSEKLVLAIDIGTTYSGMSYCIVEQGQTPEVCGVNRYPAQELVGNCKIPTIIYYDQRGNIKAVGAETLRDAERAEEENWVKAEWFKLHLGPRTRLSALDMNSTYPLPKGKSVVQVFADFLKYMYSCARIYFTESHYNGQHRWNRLAPQAEFVLSHPNGWEVFEQMRLREAAIKAGLIPDDEDGRSRLFFVTEGEASLHYCIKRGLLTEATKDGKGVAIVDAGGGTIDISTYRRSSNSSFFEEIAPSQCEKSGSIFVTKLARKYITELLQNSRFEGNIDGICEKFDEKTKLCFVDPSMASVIPFGRFLDNDEEFKVRHGRLRLPGVDVEGFFKPSLSSIIRMIETQCESSDTQISSIFLVGGFAANNWLFNKVKETFTPQGFDVCRPDGHTNKAVADGAVTFHVDHFVKTRVAKFCYGTNIFHFFDPLDPEHLKRRHLTYMHITGRSAIPGFGVILRKNTSVPEAKDVRYDCIVYHRFISDFQSIKLPISCFRGSREDPKWRDEEKDMYTTLCYVQADLSKVSKSRVKSTWLNSVIYRASIEIVMFFGLAEFKACIAWKENGVEKRGHAELVCEPDSD